MRKGTEMVAILINPDLKLIFFALHQAVERLKVSIQAPAEG